MISKIFFKIVDFVKHIVESTLALVQIPQVGKRKIFDTKFPCFQDSIKFIHLKSR